MGRFHCLRSAHKNRPRQCAGDGSVSAVERPEGCPNRRSLPLMDINDEGMDELFGKIGDKLKKIDAELRANYTGHPAAEIEPVAETSFVKAGVKMTGSLHNYAESIERDEPFQFNLG